MTDQERETVADAVATAVLECDQLRRCLTVTARINAANLIRRDVARKLAAESTQPA